jgi:hypothetical protein
MVRPRHSFFLPLLKVCYPACPERSRRERREGSAFLRSTSSSACSVNSALRETHGPTPTAPSTPLARIPAAFQSAMIDPLSPSPFLAIRHSPLATIPFRIISFADPHRLTLIESYLYKKHGRGWGPRHLAPLWDLSTHATRSNARNSNFFRGLLHSSLDIRGGGIWLSLRGSAYSAPLRYPFPLFASPPWLNTRGPQ